LTLSDKLGLNLNIDYIKAFDDVAEHYVFGAAVMGRLVVAEHLNLAARGEFVRYHTAGNTDLAELTVGAGVPVGKNFELRPEVRFDHTSDEGGVFPPTM